MAGSIANPGAALGEGLNSGADFAGKVIGAARGKQQYQQQQAANQSSANAVMADGNPGGEPDQEAAQNAAAHSDFLQSLGQGLSHIGQGINSFFAGAPPAAAAGAKPGAAPASGLPAQAGTGAAPGGAPGAVALPAGPNPQAAPVGLPQGPGAPTAGVQGGAPAYMQDGGVVPSNSGGAGGAQMVASPAGPVAAYLADGGPVPQAGPIANPGAALGAGLNSGAQFGQQVIGQAQQSQQYQQDQNARQAEAHPIEQFAAHLHSGALDDNGDAPSTTTLPPVGLPDPAATQAAAQKGANPAQAAAVGLTAQVAKDPGAQQGQPEQASKAAHSLSSDWWDQNDQLMVKAAAAAAAAGHDPDAVYQSLNHMRTSFVQGHMLRAASAASVALQNGDTDAVEQNLRNMNYYLPDGKDLNVQKDPSGALVYQNPLQQFIGPDGQPTDNAKSAGADGKMVANKPNMIPVDQAHIQMLGQAILDPMKVNDTLMATRAAVAKQRLEAAQTQAQLNTSQGRLLVGQARYGEMASTNVKNLSAAQLDQAKAVASQYSLYRWKLQAANQKLDPTALRGAQQAGSAIDDVLLGSKTSVPVSDSDGNPSLSPAAGKVVHNPSSVPKEYQNINPLEASQIRADAGSIYMANSKTGMTPQMAAQLALKLHSTKGQSHKGPDGQTHPNGYTHPNGELGIWNGKAYDRYHIDPSANVGQPPDENALIAAGIGGAPSGGGGSSPGLSNEESDTMNGGE